VLSGFLITYIICSEKVLTGALDLKNFFARRILRIWPLFYFIIGLCYILPLVLKGAGMSLSSAGYQPTLWVSVLFLENYKMIWTHDLPNFMPMAVTWSLCVEEHFYIIWGLILYVLPVKHLPKMIIISILSGIVARMIFAANDLDTSDIATHIDLLLMALFPLTC
jgi:peptidoglycan/LPS O-acetylase OafA/YrhL